VVYVTSAAQTLRSPSWHILFPKVRITAKDITARTARPAAAAAASGTTTAAARADLQNQVVVTRYQIEITSATSRTSV
jgi:hypothetical protein